MSIKELHYVTMKIVLMLAGNCVDICWRN